MPDNNKMNNNYSGMSKLEMKIRSGVDDVTRNVNAGLRDAGINVNVDDICRGFLDIGFDIGREISREFGGRRNSSPRSGGFTPPPPPYRSAAPHANMNPNMKCNAKTNTSVPKFSMPSAAERLINKNKTKIANMKTLSGFFAVFAWIFAIFAILPAVMMGQTIYLDGLTVEKLVGISITSVGCASISVFLFVINGLLRGRRRRYSRYLGVTYSEEIISLSEVSSVTGESQKRVIKDILNMIDAGYFGTEASIDVGENMLYKTRAAVSAAKMFRNARSSDDKADEVEHNSDFSTDELDYNSITDFDRITDRIRSLNDEIADAKVSERIFKIEAVTTHIFNYIKQHPEKFQSIRSFMSYYLPTTLKLLASYSAIEKAGVAGKNMSEAKESIESTLDMLVEGFSMQLDKLYEDENLDITSDVEVLKQMLAKDGLSRDDFSKFMSGYGETSAN